MWGSNEIGHFLETEQEKFFDQLKACNKAVDDGLQMNIDAMQKVEQGFNDALRAWQVILKIEMQLQRGWHLD